MPPHEENVENEVVLVSNANNLKLFNMTDVPDIDSSENSTGHTSKGVPNNDKEGVKKPDTYNAILMHAITGGLRTYLLAHGARGGLNFFLQLTMMLRKSKIRIGHAFRYGFFGKDALRFGLAFGGFSFLWKLINNGLRHARGKDDRWNGMVAGSIAGLSILAEKRERRISIAQQLFVRAMQGVYNAGRARDYFHFPHGDSLLFAVCSAQLLYAYTIQPDTIPPEFLQFMVKTARVPREVLALNKKYVTTNMPIDVEEALNILRKYKGTEYAFKVVSKMGQHPTTIPCALIHSSSDSCMYADVERFYKVFKDILPIYTALNTVSMLVFKTKDFFQNPLDRIQKSVFNTVRSSAFLSTFVSGYLTEICFHRNLVNYGLTAWDHKYLYWITGFITSLSIFLEDKRRRTDLALYVLPKAAESWYKIMYQRNWIFELHKNADVYFFSAAMGIVMAFYQHEPEVLSPIVRTVLRKFAGKN
ncbi:5378_t:CDS:2 [Ambispora gerdemannii]|uniref:5378_t:CDS:1 n=1 Tax=Ambispora gerdemannii TaxID=144530 RepID=A0A9N9FBM4_9GLOM|nr:5378_t:CDS:2 [Ambispora gerdemannii]